jgi:hypothetical protein
MTDPQYMPALRGAADKLRQAQPWLLHPYSMDELWVARSKSLAMALVVLVANIFRRAIKYYRGRTKLKMESKGVVRIKGN